MPPARRFTSRKQARFMFAKHPKIARRWVNRMKRSSSKHPIRKLPMYAHNKRKKG